MCEANLNHFCPIKVTTKWNFALWREDPRKDRGSLACLMIVNACAFNRSEWLSSQLVCLGEVHCTWLKPFHFSNFQLNELRLLLRVNCSENETLMILVLISSTYIMAPPWDTHKRLTKLKQPNLVNFREPRNTFEERHKSKKRRVAVRILARIPVKRGSSQGSLQLEDHCEDPCNCE